MWRELRADRPGKHDPFGNRDGGDALAGCTVDGVGIQLQSSLQELLRRALHFLERDAKARVVRRRLAKTLLRELVEVVKGLERPVDVGDEGLEPSLGRRLKALLQVFRCRLAFGNERLTSFGFRLIPTRIDLRGNRAGLLIL